MQKVIILFLFSLLVAPSLAQQTERITIMRYLECAQMAIEKKDVKAIDSILPDIILVREIIRDSLRRQQCVWQKNGKKEFLKPLKRLLARERQIVVRLRNNSGEGYNTITQSRTYPKIYGSNLDVDLTSDHYSISGVLSIVWNLSDDMPPIAHVLTWQPLNYICPDYSILEELLN